LEKGNVFAVVFAHLAQAGVELQWGYGGATVKHAPFTSEISCVRFPLWTFDIQGRRNDVKARGQIFVKGHF
jgi:hypothetical protein